MSKPKYWWYGNVVRVIRNYPALRAAKDAAQAVNVTANYSGVPGASGKVVTIGGRIVSCDFIGERGAVSGFGRISHFTTCPQARQFKRK